MLVPHVDPGLPLAREVDRLVGDHLAMYGERPRAIYLAKLTRTVRSRCFGARTPCRITDMAVKCARILDWCILDRIFPFPRG